MGSLIVEISSLFLKTIQKSSKLFDMIHIIVKRIIYIIFLNFIHIYRMFEKYYNYIFISNI